VSGPEYRTNLVHNAYEKLLTREPEPGALAGWLAALDAGLGEGQFTAALLASKEYAARQGPGADWVTAVYGDVLGRSPEATGLSFWTAQLQVGASGQAVALGILDSPEAQTGMVSRAYHDLLGRAPESDGMRYWQHALSDGRSRGQFIVQVLSS